MCTITEGKLYEFFQFTLYCDGWIFDWKFLFRSTITSEWRIRRFNKEKSKNVRKEGIVTSKHTYYLGYYLHTYSVLITLFWNYLFDVIRNKSMETYTYSTIEINEFKPENRNIPRRAKCTLLLLIFLVEIEQTKVSEYCNWRLHKTRPN